MNKDEDDLFKQAMQGVRRIKPDERATLHKPTTPFKRTRKKETSQPTPLTVAHCPPVASEEALYYAHPGVQERPLHQLRRGQIRWEATLDLHGLTILQAESALSEFLEKSYLKNRRYIHLIHGKGYSGQTLSPILKNQVNGWLRAHPYVLAFCSALPVDGGTGAVYVLLKKAGRNF